MRIKIIYLSKYAFKNINLSTLSGNNILRIALTIWPALENTLFDGTDVAGTYKSILKLFHIMHLTFVCYFSKIKWDHHGYSKTRYSCIIWIMSLLY